MTPLVRESENLFLKCEFLHPGRSHKARVAVSLIDDAERSGALAGNGAKVLLERTGGNLGVGLALEAGARGYALTLVAEAAYSQVKKAIARQLGATVIVRESAFPGCRDSGEAIAMLLAEDGEKYHYLNQFENPANPQTHETRTGPEIADQLRDAGVPPSAVVTLVTGMGTGATMYGVSTALRKHFAQVETVAVQPANCDLRAGVYGDHPLQGVAVGQPAPFFDVSSLDTIVDVADADVVAARTALLRSLRFHVGPTSLANYAATHKVRDRQSDRRERVYVSLLFDRGEDYV
ncbi:MAG: pyridoxal-phosphate dependent enzyme [Catenulispora sp.]|nr:pyridoxal-phosphate dependent enzyme [Catenulispora sp.]